MTSRERHLNIGSRRIGPNEPCYVIAEIGLNHNGDLGIAKQLVDAAVAAGADAVKFQKRKLTETYRKEIVEQPRLGEQGLQYIVPLLLEFELRILQVARHHVHVYAVGSGECRFPRIDGTRRLQNWLAGHDELSAHRVRRRHRKAALDVHWHVH
jgi:hypothetical protein